MAAKKKKRGAQEETSPMPTGRKDRGAGSEGPGAVDGIGGAGGSSGAGGVRATPRAVGEVSGLDQRHGVETPPMPGSVGKAEGRGSRSGQQNDGGLSGQTRGPDSETVPNRDEPE